MVNKYYYYGKTGKVVKLSKPTGSGSGMTVKFARWLHLAVEEVCRAWHHYGTIVILLSLSSFSLHSVYRTNDFGHLC